MTRDNRIFIHQEAYLDAILCAMHARLRCVSELATDIEARHARDVDEEELHQVARASEEAGVAMPLLWLGDRLCLTPSEQRVLFLLLAHELDPASRQLLRQFNTEQVADPTLDTIRRVVYGQGAQVRAGLELGAEGILRRLQLVVRTDGIETCPDHRQTFVVAPRVKALVLGEAGVDRSLEGIASIPDFGAVPDLVVDSNAVEGVSEALAEGDGLVLVSGRVGTGRRSLLVAAAAREGRDVLQIDCRGISGTRDVARRQLRAITRESMLLRRVPMFVNLEALAQRGDIADRLDLIDQEMSGLVLATSSRMLARRWKRPPAVIEMPGPTTADRATLWSRAIPEASEGDAELMATMYPLAPALILAAGAVARQRAKRSAMTTAHIAAGVRSVLDDRLVGLATRIEVTQSWSDLVVPEDQATALFELGARVRRRGVVYEKWGFGSKVGKGLGVTALFSGPPGTGKTMAACLVAKDLGVEIYRVELSKIVSKWIGETEQNLAALFDAAEACHAVLLFDEADALFGKRTEVRTSNDRHANQEVNFLLQRIETFTGICFLTTNHETAIDEAFRRRLSIHIHFPMPEVDERKALWRAMLPPDAPVDAKLGIDELAETFEMSGGYIKNAVLRAAFLAADSTGLIDGPLLAKAAQLECEAMGQVVSRT